MPEGSWYPTNARSSIHLLEAWRYHRCRVSSTSAAAPRRCAVALGHLRPSCWCLRVRISIGFPFWHFAGLARAYLAGGTPEKLAVGKPCCRTKCFRAYATWPLLNRPSSDQRSTAAGPLACVSSGPRAWLHLGHPIQTQRPGFSHVASSSKEFQKLLSVKTEMIRCV